MRRKTEGRLQAIVAAAVATFSRRGYAATQMADIARAAGVSVGTLYLYAASKEALFQAALRRAAGDLPALAPDPLPFESWDAVLADLSRYGARLGQWPQLMRAMSAKRRAGRSQIAGIVSELYELIDSNRALLKLVDVCARDVPSLSALYEREIRSRYMATLVRFVEMNTGRAPAEAAVAAHCAVELISWMAMHRHFGSRAVAADEAAIRQGTVDAAAAILA